MAVTPGKQVVRAPSRGGVPLSRYFLGFGAAALRIRGLHDISPPLEPSALTQGLHDSHSLALDTCMALKETCGHLSPLPRTTCPFSPP